MPSAYNKFNSFVEALAEKVHNLGADQIKVALTNAAPGAGNTVLANITEIAYTNCSSRNVTTLSSSQAAGIYALVLQDLILTAAGGTVGPFRYVVVYNDSATNDELIAWFDYGSAITLADGETLTLDFGTSLFTLQ
jgi:hypothetical protein